jgi:hypothetical protein
MDLYLHSPDTLSWRGAQLKRKVQGQLYLYLLPLKKLLDNRSYSKSTLSLTPCQFDDDDDDDDDHHHHHHGFSSVAYYIYKYNYKFISKTFKKYQ